MVKKKTKTVLGLDIGTNSVGWALLETLENGEGRRIVDAGVRIFEAGVDNLETDGRGEPRNLERRQARSTRRLLERRARRKSVLFHILQNAGLLPKTPDALDELVDSAKKNRAQERQTVLSNLDGQLREKHLGPSSNQVDPGLLPYHLRAEGLDRKLEPFELGRAIYHLAQRRGFKSNRKSGGDDSEDGVVKAGISALQKEMEAAGARTLGEYFSRVDPHLRRIRQQWTARTMLEDEFKSIWQAQELFHKSLLNEELFNQIFRAIFFQRPLRTQKHLIGKCTVEKGKTRAPWACLEAQRFRYLQKLNDLLVLESEAPPRPLTQEERSSAIQMLENKEKVSFRQLAKGIGCPKAKFNLEAGGEKHLPGNKVSARLHGIMGTDWERLSIDKQADLVNDLNSIHEPETVIKRATLAWGMDGDQAKKLANLKLEEGYCNFSRKALRRLLPELHEGVPLQAAIKDLYNFQAQKTPVLNSLPPVQDILDDLRNPVVLRCLTELRKVVNALIRRHGKMDVIRVELARSVKNSPKRRQDIIKRNRANQNQRAKAAKKIVAEVGIQNPKRDDILRVLLAEECNWICPYTGRSINIGQLFGPEAEFDIEHIIPFDRSLDNSYMNKTLCLAHENRHVKKNKTPYEAYSGDPQRWKQILLRIGAKDGLPQKKQRLFTADGEELKDYLANFSNQQLVNTAYATRLAVKYLGHLFGGDVDADNKRRIFVVSGGATAVVRNLLNLNGILSQGSIKSRDDHRHHTVDALAVALTTSGMIQRISNTAKRASDQNVRIHGMMDPPWDGFLADAMEAIHGVVVSHRADRRLQGGLHEDSNYSPSRDENGQIEENGKYVHIRKPLTSMSRKDLDNIIDEKVRELVKSAVGDKSPDKVFADPGLLPRFPGTNHVIKKARIKKVQATRKMGSGGGARYVAAGSNHHIEILAAKDRRGKDCWEGVVVSRYEAMQRMKKGEPVVQRDHGPDKQFVFSLCGGDIFEVDGEDGSRELYRVRVITAMSSGQISVKSCPVQDARLVKDLKMLIKDPNPLRKLNCRKVEIGPLGEKRYSSD